MSAELPKETEAIVVHEFGGNDKLRLESVPVVPPGEGEVVVRVEGAGVNPVDWKVVRGFLKRGIPHELPFVPGWELAGHRRRARACGAPLRVG